ncbi:hypothetical protein STEG23_035227 [Scotinomys teguina]
MGLCYSLRPLFFGSSGDAPCAGQDPSAEDAQPSAIPASAPAPVPAPVPAGTLLRRGGGRNPASARPAVELQSRRRQEQLRAEEREAAKEARKVSRGIDRMLREQKRDLQQTHRLLLLVKVFHDNETYLLLAAPIYSEIIHIKETPYGVFFQCGKAVHLGKNLLLTGLLDSMLYKLDMQDP